MKELLTYIVQNLVEKPDEVSVTEREANRVAELVSTISGVRRVVKVFQLISEDELARKLPRPVSPAASESSPQP